MPCLINGCSKKAHNKGLCSFHYAQDYNRRLLEQRDGFVALWEQVREKTILLALSFIKQLNQIVSGQMPPPNRSVSCV